MSLKVLVLCALAATSAALTLRENLENADSILADQRKADNLLNQKSEWPFTKEGKIPVWILYEWPKGAPAYINLNMQAIRRNADPSKFEITLVNSSNIKQLVPDMPEEWDRLPDEGAKSDVVRASLLAHHGGVYMDGDVLVARPLTEMTNKLADHDMVSYTSNGQKCQAGAFSSNVMAARKGNRLSTTWWEQVKMLLKQSCELPAKQDMDKRQGVCCYDEKGQSRRCHIPWAALGERTGHPTLKALLKQKVDPKDRTTEDLIKDPNSLLNKLMKSDKPYNVYCFNEPDAGFAPDSNGKILWRKFQEQPGEKKCGEGEECPCWLKKEQGEERTLQCSGDNRQKKMIFDRIAYHMFSHINNLGGLGTEEEILNGHYVGSHLYRKALGK